MIFLIGLKNTTGNGFCAQEMGHHFKKTKKNKAASQEHTRNIWRKAPGEERLQDLACLCTPCFKRSGKKNLNSLLNETCICGCGVSSPLWSLPFHFCFHLSDFSYAFKHHFEKFKASPGCHFSQLVLALAKLENC